MKNFVSFVCLAVVALMMVSVDARSPAKCPSTCDTNSCAPVDCGCGTYKDECNCCDYCLSCANSVCSLIRGDVCVEGHTCAHPVGTDYMDRMNGDGKCVPSHTVTDGMYSP